jgi:hypothetical protein
MGLVIERRVPLRIRDIIWNKSQLWRLGEVHKEIKAKKHPEEPPNLLNKAIVMQDEIWVDKHGISHKIDDMSEHYIRNVINFLHRRARRIQDYHCMVAMEVYYSHDGGDMANDALYSEMHYTCDTDPNQWLDETPLLMKLHERLS